MEQMIKPIIQFIQMIVGRNKMTKQEKIDFVADMIITQYEYYKAKGDVYKELVNVAKDVTMPLFARS